MSETPAPEPRYAAVITVSDRGAAGERVDESGPVAVHALRAGGFTCGEARIVPDGAHSVAAALHAAIAEGARLIVTTGGTGVSPRDETPEGTARVLSRQIPGIAEELRRVGAAAKPAGMLSRGLAGVVDDAGALVVNLPGSPRAVAEGMPVVLAVAGHVLDQLEGGDHG
jgi:molybdenum cofactor synthesis domain-containing protein